MARIGILGGSFNPPHKGHRAMAVAAGKQYDLDTVFFMPTSRPPHKDKGILVEDAHRIRMVKKMIETMPFDESCTYRFSDFEMRRNEVSYTWQTLRDWKRENPSDTLFFIMGGDSLADFSGWCKPEEIVKSATILAAGRCGLKEKELSALCKKRSEEFGGTFLPVSLNDKWLDVSSRDIRDELTGSDSGSKFLTKRVNRYIRLHGLYGTIPLKYNDPPKEKTIRACLKATLKPRRYLHTLGVAEVAEILGRRIDEEYSEELRLGERARLSGLLHDCAKYYSDEEQIDLCEKYGIPLTQTERENPALIHGKLGAYIAEKRYGVRDKEILSAIRCHTVGKPDMTLLEKILYIADYIEPGRIMDTTPHSLESLRDHAFEPVGGRDAGAVFLNDLKRIDQVLTDIMENTITYLKESGRIIDPLTEETWRWYHE